jgi:hypothetical protein
VAGNRYRQYGIVQSTVTDIDSVQTQIRENYLHRAEVEVEVEVEVFVCLVNHASTVVCWWAFPLALWANTRKKSPDRNEAWKRGREEEWKRRTVEQSDS